MARLSRKNGAWNYTANPMKTSDKILLGIYTGSNIHCPDLNSHISFETAELAWILYNGLDGWGMEDGCKKKEYPAENDRHPKW